MIVRVSKVRGTSGIRKTGKVEGSSPMSPTVRRSSPNARATAVRATMQTSGEGTERVSMRPRDPVQGRSGCRW